MSSNLPPLENDMPLPDAADRARALDPAQSFIVQAPAGSGKTELLTQRYLRLLATVDDPEQILAITFTRKAAAEMRQRILDALATSPDAPSLEKPRNAITAELATAARAANERHGWRLQDNAARLRVQTIDSLNFALARRLPVLSATGASLSPAEDARPLYEAAALRVLERLGETEPHRPLSVTSRSAEDSRAGNGDEHSAATRRTSAAVQVEVLLRHLANRADRLVELLVDLLAQRDQWLHHVAYGRGEDKLRELIQGALGAVVDRHLVELHATLPAGLHLEITSVADSAAANLLRESAEHSDADGWAAFIERQRLPAPHHNDLAMWKTLERIFLTKDKRSFYRSLTKRQGFPTTDRAVKARAEALLNDMRDVAGLESLWAAVRDLPDPVYSEEQWQVLEALLDVLPLAVAELQLVFQEQGVTDYIEGALRALRALGESDAPTDVLLALDYRLRHILIDEFQDTSFTQLDLLERLTAGWQEGDGRTLFCVGDPMQSVYRFRQAEVGLFLQLQSSGIRNLTLETLRLRANFRSSCPVIDWINSTFPGVLAERNDPEHGAVVYSPCVAHSAAPSHGGVHVHPMFVSGSAIQARQAVELAQSALAADKHGTVGILVATRPHIGPLLRELENAQIAYQAVEIERLHERPAVQDLLALTRALVHLADRTAWLAVLRAPWCGLTLHDLHVLVAAPAMSADTIAPSSNSSTGSNTVVWTLIEQCLEKRMRESEGTDAAVGKTLDFFAQPSERESPLSEDGLARLRRVEPILRAALAQRGRSSLRDWVERTWLSLGGPATVGSPQDLEDAEAYFERLDELETAGDLEDVARLESQLQNLFAKPRSSMPNTPPGSGTHDASIAGAAQSAPRVEVMTIHKAKGLEFDTVVLLGLERTPRNDDAKLLRWMRVANLDSPGLILAPITAEGQETDPIYRWLDKIEKRRSSYERARLLYVAATRAKRELHLLGSVQYKTNEEGAKIMKPKRGSMLHMLWSTVESDYERALQDLTPHPSVAAEAEARNSEAEPMATLRRLPLDWALPLPHVSAATPGAKPLRTPDAEQPEFDWVSETRRHVGTLVHRNLERSVRRSDAVPSAVPDFNSLRAAFDIELAELGVPPAHRQNACDQVIEALTKTWADDRGRWILDPDSRHSEAAAELELTGVIDGDIVNIVIDRTFVDAAGDRWIVDYKTSTHEGGNLEAFLANEELRYRPQLVRYARLLRAYKPDRPVRTALYFPMLGQWREVETSTDYKDTSGAAQ